MLLAEAIAVAPRFARSANLERDATRLEPLEGYVVTARALDVTERIASTAAAGGAGGAWSLTGPYGSGKSSLGLLLDAAFGPAGHARYAAERLVQDASEPVCQLVRQGHARHGTIECGFHRGLVTAHRESLSHTVLRALHSAVCRSYGDPPWEHFAAADTLTAALDDAASDDPRRASPSPSALVAIARCLAADRPLLLILDEFGKSRGFRRVELQPNNGNSTAGRHSGPLTRGSLYPLALNRCDLSSWMRATFLSQEEIAGAFELAGFIQANAEQGRDKLTLFLPREWSGGAIWTKQDFEESLGKSEKIGVKVAIGEKIKLRNYFAPKDTLQDRCFLVVNVRGLKNVDTVKVGALRRAGYPLAVLNLHGKAALARYMQVIHYTVFGLGYLRNMNFVTQPSVELYKKIANDLNVAARKEGGIEKTETWRSMLASDCRLKWRGGLSVNFEALCELGLLGREALNLENRNAAAVYAEALRSLVESQQATYGELTYFGDTRYSTSGKALRRVLDRAAEGVFRSRLKMPADVYEGPAMNHSYHEMIIGYGRGFSTVLLTEKAESFRRVPYPADYHRAQWLATQQALASRGRAVVGIMIRDLGERSRQTVAEFFAEVARRLARRRS